MASNYAKAYTEVLEIINHFSEEERELIPEEKIKFFNENCDKNYDFRIDTNMPLEDQNISKEANAIIVVLYRDYFATEEEKQKIEVILKKNSEEKEKLKREKYNPDDLFKNNQEESKENNIKQNEEIKEVNTSELLIVKKEDGFFKRFINYIKSLFSKKS